MTTTVEFWQDAVTEDIYEQWLEQAIESTERNQQSEDEFWELIDIRNMGFYVDKARLRSLAWHVFCGDEELIDEHINGTYIVPGSSSHELEIQADPQKYFLNKSFSPVLLGRDIVENYLKVFSDGRKLYHYRKGVYKPDGEIEFENLALKLLGTWWRANYSTEALKWAKKFTVPSKPEFINPNDELINVQNGLVNWKTGKLLSHTPQRLGTIQLPVVYDPTANDPVVKEFLSSVMPEDAADTLLEMIGYCLLTHTKYEKAIMLIGSGANGKSTVLNLLTALIGQVNTTNISLQDLETHRFKIAELQNKLVNMFADLPRTAMTNSSNFKAIVSGDSINAERKNKDPFNFRPFAKLIFSTNEFPRTADMTDGFFRRWLIIPFEQKFTPDKADVKLIDRLTTPSALSTLLNYALEGLRRLETNGKFTECETITRAVKTYRDAYDTIKVFTDECCVVGEQLSCLKDDLYAQYQVWSQKSGLKPYGKIKFNERIAKQYQDTRIKGESNKRWVGISLRQA